MRTELTNKYFGELYSLLERIHDGKGEAPEPAMAMKMSSAEEIGSAEGREEEAQAAARKSD